MTNSYTVIDVETANQCRASICEIGLVRFEQGRIAWRWSTLVNPEEDFGDQQTKIHGIRPEHVRDSPVWTEVYSKVKPALDADCVFHWGSFDREALGQVSGKYSLPVPHGVWLDACDLAKQVWPNLRNYKLSQFAANCDDLLRSHRAEDDALLLSAVIVKLLRDTSTPITDLIVDLGQQAHAEYQGPVKVRNPVPPKMDGLANRPFSGGRAVFTGDFALGKTAMAELAAQLGLDVRRGVSKRTTICIVGSYDEIKYGRERSSKHQAAEDLRRAGQNIEIMTERDFLTLAESYGVVHPKSSSIFVNS